MTKTVTVDPEVAVKIQMVMVTFQKKKWRWIWNSREKNLRMFVFVRCNASNGWFSLFGMLLYPFAVVLANWIGLDTASKILGDMDHNLLCFSC